VSYPVVINLGVGRSGTTFIYNVLRRRYADEAFILHEDLSARRARMRRFFRCFEQERIALALAEPSVAAWVERVEKMAQSRPVVVTGCTTAHLAPVLLRVFGDRLRTVHVHRHPLSVCAAVFVGPWGVEWDRASDWKEDPNIPILTPFDPSTRYRALQSRWNELGPFARIAYSWLERTSAGLEFSQRNPHVPTRVLSAESEVFGSEAYLEAIAGFAGLTPRDGREEAQPARNASWRRSLEERPLGTAWHDLQQIPEVTEFARSLGYGFDDAELESRAARYQLPAGLGSRLRHRTRFWQARRWLARWLREKALIPRGRPAEDGGEPRSLAEAVSEVLDTRAARTRAAPKDLRR